MVNTAPGLDIGVLELSLTLFQSNGLLADHNDLLIFHVETRAMEFSLHRVLDLCLGPLTAVLVFPEERRRNVLWEDKLETDCIVSWLEMSIRELEDMTIEVKELLFALNSLMAFVFTILPMANKLDLFLALEMETERLAIKWRGNFNVDFTIHSVSGFVVREFGLKDHFT